MYSKCWHYIHRNAPINQAGNAFQYYVCIKERESLYSFASHVALQHLLKRTQEVPLEDGQVNMSSLSL